MKNKLFIALVAAMSGLGFSQASYAYLPLVDNQPRATKSCPIDQAISTESSDGKVGSMNVECVVDGINVVYTVTVPPGCENGGCGLIFDNHGMTMNADQQDAGTKLRQFGWTATQYGAPTPFIVVQPSLTDLFDKEQKLDFASVLAFPLAYLKELPNILYFVEHMISVYRVDNNRTHMYGFSRGGATVNAIYCNKSISGIFASYAIGGFGLRCALDQSLMIIHGDKDPVFAHAIKDAEEKMLALGDVTATSVVNDPDYSKPKFVKSADGIQRQGQHHHMRFQHGDLTLETIRHSATSKPALGHCHASESKDSWLVCHANMETGQKLVDFFIQNPRRY